MTLKSKISTTILEAAKSREKFRVAAILWQGGKIKGIGRNIVNNIFETKPGKRKGGIHAEALAIIRANSNRVDWKKATITIARIGRAGAVRKAKPCKDCMRLIRRLGIRNVYWTEDKSN